MGTYAGRSWRRKMTKVNTFEACYKIQYTLRWGHFGFLPSHLGPKNLRTLLNRGCSGQCYNVLLSLSAYFSHTVLPFLQRLFNPVLQEVSDCLSFLLFKGTSIHLHLKSPCWDLISYSECTRCLLP